MLTIRASGAGQGARRALRLLPGPVRRGGRGRFSRRLGSGHRGEGEYCKGRVAAFGGRVLGVVEATGAVCVFAASVRKRVFGGRARRRPDARTPPPLSISGATVPLRGARPLPAGVLLLA